MDREELLERLRATRRLSIELARPLRPEDYRAQSMPDVSPPWWNLGHTTWFFAKNVLEPRGLYAEEDSRLEYVLNSYYESLGPRLERSRRGLQTRPTTGEILAFRERTDERLERLVRDLPEAEWQEASFLLTAGIQHEQQHQELLVTEIKHILATNAPELREPYRATWTGAATGETGAAPCCGAIGRDAVTARAASSRAGAAVASPSRATAASGTRATAIVDEPPSGGAGCDGRRTAEALPLVALELPGGLDEIGHRDDGWCFDNELAVHKAWLEPFAAANRLVTNREYLAFVEDGGYRDPLLWLANGWAAACEHGWQAPLYWERGEGGWRQWTLAGRWDLALDEPVCHVSFYEADAFARWLGHNDAAWAGARLLTEREWEHAARRLGFAVETGNFLEDGRLHPAPAPAPARRGEDLAQAAGDVWEWTSSHYEAYPGYVPFDGNLTEYNGKFMDNQRVLRGGSCATPRSHIRVSYRNFWAPDTRFQFTGIRLGRGLGGREAAAPRRARLGSPGARGRVGSAPSTGNLGRP